MDGVAGQQVTRDIDDLGRVYDVHSGPVAAVLSTLVRDPLMLDTGVAQTFLTAWQASRSFESSRPLAPWLFTLARRVGVELASSDVSSGSGQQDPVGNSVLPPPDLPGLDQTWEIWEVRTAVDQLSEREAIVLRLEHFERLTHPEIADRLGIAVGTVKSRSYGAHRHLVRSLAPMIGGVGEGIGNGLDLRTVETSTNLSDLVGTADEMRTVGTVAEGDRARLTVVPGDVSVGDGAAISGEISDEAGVDPQLSEQEIQQRQLEEEHETALSWYLHGHADGSALEVAQREVIQRIRRHLATTWMWVRPSQELRFRLLAEASGQPVDSASGNPVNFADEARVSSIENTAVAVPGLNPLPHEQIDPVGDESLARSSRRLHMPSKIAADDGVEPRQSGFWPLLMAGAAMVVLLGFIGMRVFQGADEPIDSWIVQVESQSSVATGPATVVVRPTAGGLELELTPSGLGRPVGGSYYAVWLQTENRDRTVPVGSFWWRGDESAVTLTSGVDPAPYSRLLVTSQSEPTGESSLRPSDTVVYAGSITRSTLIDD